MKTQVIEYFKKRFFEPRTMVVLYHRIASPVSDIWDFSINPEYFEQQLQVLKKTGKVVPLSEMIEGLKKKELKHKTIAITFDDGYADNFSVAKPLLEQYEIPATFFITSGMIEARKGYWWDELEQLILFTEQLPQRLTLTINLAILDFDLGMETILTEFLRYQHAFWKVSFAEEPPTKRARLFLQLWKAIRPLLPDEQKTILQNLKKWAGLDENTTLGYNCMTTEQVKDLANHDLFEIGAHSVSHPVLSNFPRPYQEREIKESKRFLEILTGHPVTYFAYPFGNYNENLREIISLENFDAAFTNEEECLDESVPFSRIPRFKVINWSGRELERNIQRWRTINS